MKIITSIHKAVGSSLAGPVMAGPNFRPIMKNCPLEWFSSLSKLRKKECAGRKSVLRPSNNALECTREHLILKIFLGGGSIWSRQHGFA